MKTREELKELAIYAMQKMEVDKPFVNQFARSDKVTMYIGGFGYTIDKQTEDRLLAVINQVEKDYNVLVYAVSKNMVCDDTVYSLLVVTNQDNKSTILSKRKIDGIPAYDVFAYAYNATEDHFSEFGYITVQNLYGGIRRIRG